MYLAHNTTDKHNLISIRAFQDPHTGLLIPYILPNKMLDIGKMVDVILVFILKEQLELANAQVGDITCPL
jgi:hypothetical protein